MLFIANKYTRWYYGIINRAISRNHTSRKVAKSVLGYVECHHIIPRSLGGLERDNLVYLTAKEHFVCHHLLTKMTEGENKAKMYKALHKMSSANSFQERHRIPSYLYERIRIEAGRSHSLLITGIMSGENNPMYGRQHSEESKKKMSINRSGKCGSRTEEGKRRHADALSKRLKGVPKTEDHRKAISDSWDREKRAGVNAWAYGRTHDEVTREKMRIAAAKRWSDPESKLAVKACRTNDPINTCTCGKQIKGAWNFIQHTKRCAPKG